jgi:hypothetical protein
LQTFHWWSSSWYWGYWRRDDCFSFCVSLLIFSEPWKIEDPKLGAQLAQLS